MTDIDFSKIKVGGIIGVRVKRVDSFGLVWIEDAAGEERAFGPPDLLSYTPPEPEPLKMGDRVKNPWNTIETERLVAFIDGEHVYLAPLSPGANMSPRPLSEVETWERLS